MARTIFYFMFLAFFQAPLAMAVPPEDALSEDGATKTKAPALAADSAQSTKMNLQPWRQ